MPTYPVESPEWWCQRLYDRLVDRQDTIAWFDQYYRGDHPLPWLPEQIQDIALRILKMTRSNYMGLVVDATTERQEVLGFKIGDSTEGDKEAYRIWQANNLDSLSSEAFLEATKCGCSYWMVAPNADDATTPLVTVEHPSQVIVEYEPGNVRKRSAGMKMWFDDRRNMVMATLFLGKTDTHDALIYKYQGPKDSKPERWVKRIVAGEDWPARNPLDVVPIIEMRNNPQSKYKDGKLQYIGISELTDVTDVQDRINKTIADRLVTQDFGAFPQKWATGWAEDDDEEEDQSLATAPEVVTGQTVRKHPAGRVNMGRDRLIVATDENAKFGSFEGTSLDPYSGAKNEDVKDIASRTRTPSQYLLGEMVNISGDALIAAESGLVSKVKQRMRSFGETLEEVVRLYLLAAGDNRADDKGCATMWRDPTFRTEAQLTDAVIKRHLAGLISWNQAMEDLGYTPDQIEQNRKDKLADALANAALNFAGLFNAPVFGKAATDNNISSGSAGGGEATTAAGTANGPGPAGGGVAPAAAPTSPGGRPAGQKALAVGK